MHPSQVSRFQRLSGPLLVAAVFGLAWVFFSTRGLGSVAEGAAVPIGGFLAATAALVQASLIPLAYLFGAFGLGRLVLALLNRCADALERPFVSHTLQLAAGLGAMLFLSHGMGLAGLLTGNSTTSLLIAWLPIAIGLLMLLDQVARGSLRPESWPVLPRAAALWSLPLALTLVAAASPPGWLWESEFGGYDAMSYHLQLPKEWATPGPEGVGRLWPVLHNVYSYLPSYFEAAFLHVGAMTPASTVLGSGAGLTASERLVGGEGTWLLSCQMLHAFTGLIAALLVARCVYVVILRVETALTPAAATLADRHAAPPIATRSSALLCACVAGAAVLATPWSVVVGSLAYNEMPMLALLAGAMLVVVERPPTRKNPCETRRLMLARAALVGALVGLACSVKPTALLLGAPTVGVWMLMQQPTRRWLWSTLAGSIAGIGVMLPWLVRNTLASGNPVFPFAATIFGRGHWSDQQLATYSRNHAPEFSFFDALAALVGNRGFGHAQWWGGWLPVLVLALLLAAIADRSLRRAALALLIGLALQVIAWAITTHQQSRFLLPLLVPMAIAIGLGAHAILTRWAAWTISRNGSRSTKVRAGQMDARLPGERQPRIASAVLMLIPLALALASCVQFLSQRGGQPNVRLTAGPGVVSGLGLAEAIALNRMPNESEFYLRNATPEQWINLWVHPGVAGQDWRVTSDLRVNPAPSAEPPGAVYLLGDATPIYYADATGGPSALIRYHTTWDRSPLGEAIRAAPDDPERWIATLEAGGIEFVLANPQELSRLCVRDKYYDADVTLDRVKMFVGALYQRHNTGRSHLKSGERTSPGIKLWVPSGALQPKVLGSESDGRDLGLDPFLGGVLWRLYRLTRPPVDTDASGSPAFSPRLTE